MATGLTAERTSWNRDTLPEGAEKVKAVREMFDTIAPRYDLVNRIMTFRLDVRWRRKSIEALSLPRGSTVLDLASGTGDMCVDLDEGGTPADLDRSQPRHAQGRPQRCAAGAGRHPAPADPRRRRRRHHVRVRVAQPRRAPAVLPGAGQGRPPGRTDRAARRRHSPQPAGPIRPRHLLRQDRAEGRRLAVRPGRVPLPPEERRVPPARRIRWSRRCAGPASAMPATAGSRSGSPNCSRAPGTETTYRRPDEGDR